MRWERSSSTRLTYGGERDVKPTNVFPWSLFWTQLSSLTLSSVPGRLAAVPSKSNGSWRVSLFSYDTDGRVATRSTYTHANGGTTVLTALNTTATYTRDLQDAVTLRTLTVGANTWRQWYDYDGRGLGPVAVAGDHDLVGVVGQPIERGGGQQRTLKEIGPLAEGPIGRDDQRAAFVALVDDFVEVLARGGVEGLEAEVIHDEEVGPQVAGEAALIGAVGAAPVEMGQHPTRAGEEDVAAAPTGLVPAPAPKPFRT